MKYYLLLTFFVVSFWSKAQFISGLNSDKEILRDPVSFSHQPILLLKITPTALLGRDNVMQFGAELAPPFGKFSFGFDYGKGKGSWSLNKDQKANFPEQQTRIIRAEIRGYFSDWYPFYALDKKPFGRYYSLEYVNKILNYSSLPSLRLYNNTFIPAAEKVPVMGKEQALHVKFGKHFIVSKWFFIDAYAGIGVGKYENPAETWEQEMVKEPFSFRSPERKVGTQGLFLSKTAGVRLCLPL